MMNSVCILFVTLLTSHNFNIGWCQGGINFGDNGITDYDDYTLGSFSGGPISPKLGKSKITVNEIEAKLGGSKINAVPNVAGASFPADDSCYRTCSTNPSTRKKCQYNFKLSHYLTMSTACQNCNTVPGDCYRNKCIPADGVKRVIEVVNQMLPGPSIRVCEGDTVVVQVHNELREPTTIHWHGIHQKSTPFMDGVPGVTQCPIPPRESFRYEFQVPIGGTYFWHSHSGFQRGDGIFGSLIVRKAPEKEPNGRLYDFDLPEHEMIMMDWQLEYTLSVFVGLEHGNRDFRPNNILINGRGFPRDIFNNTASTNSRGGMTPLYEVRIRQGSSYRLRLISNGVASCPIEISIENHRMTVIASDGFDIKPVVVDSLVIYAGERWDVVVSGNQAPGSYWIKYRGLNVCNSGTTKVYQVAVLNYETIPPRTLPRRFIRNWNEAAPSPNGIQLNPLNAGPGVRGQTVTVAELNSVQDDDPEIISRSHPDHQFYLSYDFNPIDTIRVDGPHLPMQVANINGRRFTPQLNYISHVIPKTPLLTQPEGISSLFICNNENNHFHLTNPKPNRGQRLEHRNCTQEYCACTHLLKVELNSIVEIVLIDKGRTLNANHPFHLHGHSFRVVSMVRLGNSTDTKSIQLLDQRNQIPRRRSQAPIKDDVTVPDGGYTILRFRADNPGFWFFHCHIEFHVEVGMGLIFQVGEISDMKRPSKNFPRCGTDSGAESSVEPIPEKIIKPSEEPISFGDTPSSTATFRNPIDSSGQTPSIYFNSNDKIYYWPIAVGREIRVRKNHKLTDWSRADERTVFTAPPALHGSVVDPKIQKIGGHFYIYFHMTQYAEGSKSRLFVIKAIPNTSPIAYGSPVRLDPANGDLYGQTPSVLQHANSMLYIIWSGRQTWQRSGARVLHIAVMANPTKVVGPTHTLYKPKSPWEGVIGRDEGSAEYQEIIHRGNKYFMLFNANERESNDYCIGMAVLEGLNLDPLISSNWRRIDQCLLKSNEAEGVRGVGPFSVTILPEREETWIVYNAWESQSQQRGSIKTTRAQRLTWSPTGNFLMFPQVQGLRTSQPVPVGQPIR